MGPGEPRLRRVERAPGRRVPGPPRDTPGRGRLTAFAPPGVYALPPRERTWLFCRRERIEKGATMSMQTNETGQHGLGEQARSQLGAAASTAQDKAVEMK